MIRERRLIRDSVKHLVRAAEASVDDLKSGLVEQEPHLTDRMLGRMAQAMEGYKTKGVTWTAKTLTDHGPDTQEKVYGADFVGVLEIDVPGYKVKKGFLAQAKLVNSASGIMRRSEFNRMIGQCEQMLNLSPSSYVFYQSPNGIRVIPAVAVLAASRPEVAFNTEGFYSRALSAFYEEHFECFIGDRRISEPSEKTLKELHARYLLFLAARMELRG